MSDLARLKKLRVKAIRSLEQLFIEMERQIEGVNAEGFARIRSDIAAGLAPHKDEVSNAADDVIDGLDVELAGSYTARLTKEMEQALNKVMIGDKFVHPDFGIGSVVKKEGEFIYVAFCTTMAQYANEDQLLERCKRFVPVELDERRKAAVIHNWGIDWSSIDPQVMWLAKDKDGRVFGFFERPTIKEAFNWWSAKGVFTANCQHLNPTFKDIPWRKSLIERP